MIRHGEGKTSAILNTTARQDIGSEYDAAWHDISTNVDAESQPSSDDGDSPPNGVQNLVGGGPDWTGAGIVQTPEAPATHFREGSTDRAIIGRIFIRLDQAAGRLETLEKDLRTPFSPP